MLEPGLGIERAKSESNFEDSLPARVLAKDRVIINVGGYRHETYLSTLRVVPDSRLAWIAENASKQAEYDPENNEYFFDRHPGVFASIINYYRTGKLHTPSDVCGPLFEEELAFWGIDELQMEPCCWSNYTQHRDAQATLKAFEGLQKSVEESENEASAFKVRHKESSRTKWKKEIWAMLEQPYSSKYAQMFAMVSLIVIVLSVLTFCLESIEDLKEDYKSLFEGMEYFYLVWFSADFLARLCTCPSLPEFFKTFMTWVDITSVVPLYVNLSNTVTGTLTFLFVLRLIRIFRLFRFFRTMSGMQVIGHTLRASARELFLLVLILLIPMVIFSTLVFYAEKTLKPPSDSDFDSIPEAFWWAVITMTTVGYGDTYPKSLLGRILGAICACVGVLIVALPVSVIGSNFTLFYSHAQAQLKLPKKKRTPILLGAAGALVSESTLYNNEGNSHSSEAVSNPSPRDETLPLPRKSLRNPSITPRCRSTRREAVLPPSTLPRLESDTSDVEHASNVKKSAEELFSSPPTDSAMDISSGLRGASDVMLHITAPSHRRMAISPAPTPPGKRQSQRKRRRGGSKRLANRGNGDVSSHEKERDSYYTTTDGDSAGESGIPGKSQSETSPQEGYGGTHESSNESNTSEHKNNEGRRAVLSDEKTEDEMRPLRDPGDGRDSGHAHVNLRGVTFDSSKDYNDDEKEQERQDNKIEPAPPWRSSENLNEEKNPNKLSAEPRVRSRSELASSDTPPGKRRNAIGGNRGITSLPISPLVRSEEKVHRPPANGSFDDLKGRKCIDSARNSQYADNNSPQELKHLQHSTPSQSNNVLESEGRDDMLRSAIRGHKRDNIQNMTRV